MTQKKVEQDAASQLQGSASVEYLMATLPCATHSLFTNAAGFKGCAQISGLKMQGSYPVAAELLEGPGCMLEPQQHLALLGGPSWSCTSCERHLAGHGCVAMFLAWILWDRYHKDLRACQFLVFLHVRHLPLHRSLG